MSEAIKARFLAPAVGQPGHEHLSGIPARDLTEAEFDALPQADRLRVRNAKRTGGAPLYEVRAESEMHPSRSAPKSSDKG